MPSRSNEAFRLFCKNELVILSADNSRFVLEAPHEGRLFYELVDDDEFHRDLPQLSDEARDAGFLPLFVVRSASPELIAAALDGEIGLVSTEERMTIVEGRQLPPPDRKSGNANYRLCALARLLLSSEGPWLQSLTRGSRTAAGIDYVPLSQMLGSSQGYVSVMMKQLPAGSVEVGTDGCRVVNFDQLWDWHLSEYRGPWGLTAAFSSTRKRLTQARDGRRALEVATGWVNDTDDDAPRVSAHPILSGIEAIPETLARDVLNVGDDPGVDHPVTLLSEVWTSVGPATGYRSRAPWNGTLRIAQIVDPYLRLTASAWGSAQRTDPLVTAWALENRGGREIRDWARSVRSEMPRHVVVAL